MYELNVETRCQECGERLSSQSFTVLAENTETAIDEFLDYKQEEWFKHSDASEKYTRGQHA